MLQQQVTDTDKTLGSAVRVVTNGQMDGHYQMYYLPGFAVDKNAACLKFVWLSHNAPLAEAVPNFFLVRWRVGFGPFEKKKKTT